MDGIGRLRRQLRRVDGTLRGGGKGWILLSVAVGWLLTLGLRFVVPALLPAITAEFDVDNATAGVAVTVLWLTYAGMQFPAGLLTDRVGERTLLTASLLVAGSSLLGYALVPTFGPFLLITALFGAGTGLFGPARGTTLSKTYPRNDGAAFGAVLAAGSIGSAALPFLASLVTVRLGWRAALGSAAPAFLVVAVGTWRTVPDRPKRRQRRREGDDPNDGAATDRTDRADEAGSTGGAGAVLSAVASRSVLLAGAGAALMLFAFQALTAFLTTYLVEVKGLSQGAAGGLFALLFLSGAVFQSASGGLADRYGYGRVLAAVSLAGIPPLLALPYVEGLVPLATMVIGLGVRLAIGPVSNAYVVRVLPDEVQGSAWGLLRSGFFVIGAFGSTVVGVMADRESFYAAFVLLAVLSAAAAVVYLLLPDRGAVA